MTTTPLRASAALLLALLALAALAACSSGPSGGGPVRFYTVRAQVIQLPAQGARERLLNIRHEAIDAYVDETGKVVGMDAMVMKFALAPAVSLEGVRVGDKVEVEIAVGFSPPTFRIDRVRRLPDETVLSFDRARPPVAR